MTSDPSSCEFKQGGAGLETVWEAFPVSNGSINMSVCGTGFENMVPTSRDLWSQ